MSQYKPLKFRDILTILKNLGFEPDATGATSHQTWILQRYGKAYAVTIMYHGSGKEFKQGTLGSIIRQSGFTKKEFYGALTKKKQS